MSQNERAITPRPCTSQALSREGNPLRYQRTLHFSVTRAGIYASGISQLLTPINFSVRPETNKVFLEITQPMFLAPSWQAEEEEEKL